MLARAWTRWWTPDYNLLTVDVFNGAEWRMVVSKEIGDDFCLTKARNTNRLLAINERHLSSRLYIIRDGELDPVDCKPMKMTNYLYEMDDGFHQLQCRSVDIESRHVNGDWMRTRVPASHCCITHSLDDNNIYMLCTDKTELISPALYGTNVRIVGRIENDKYIGSTIVVGGIMHIYDVKCGRIDRYDPRVSHRGTTVFANDKYDPNTHHLSMFLNDHTFIRVCIRGKVDMVDLRNSTVYALPSLTFGAYSSGILGIYG